MPLALFCLVWELAFRLSLMLAIASTAFQAGGDTLAIAGAAWFWLWVAGRVRPVLHWIGFRVMRRFVRFMRRRPAGCQP